MSMPKISVLSQLVWTCPPPYFFGGVFGEALGVFPPGGVQSAPTSKTFQIMKLEVQTSAHAKNQLPSSIRGGVPPPLFGGWIREFPTPWGGPEGGHLNFFFRI